MVRIWHFHCRDPGSIPGWGTEILHTLWHRKERTKERKGKQREREGKESGLQLLSRGSILSRGVR